MVNEDLYAPIREKYQSLQNVLEGEDLQSIIELALEVHAMVHPGSASGLVTKTISDTGNALKDEEAISFGKMIDVKALKEYMVEVSKNTREILRSLTIDKLKEKPTKEQLGRIVDEGGLTSEKQSIWLLDYWGGLTVSGMILTPLTDHHMMHLPPCLGHLPILFL